MKIQLSDHFTYKMLLRFVLPSIIMMVFTSIYGVVDGLFVSNFVGKTPFAAVNLVMPFIMVFGGIGFMFGTGGSALVAKTMGEGDKHRANQYFTMIIAATLICGVIISTLGVIFMEPISVFLGADAEMLPDCVLYGRIVLAFNTAYMLQNVFQSFLIAAEKPKLGLWVTVAAGVTNMALDALFMAVFHWGVGVGVGLEVGDVAAAPKFGGDAGFGLGDLLLQRQVCRRGEVAGAAGGAEDTASVAQRPVSVGTGHAAVQGELVELFPKCFFAVLVQGVHGRPPSGEFPLLYHTWPPLSAFSHCPARPVLVN